MLINSDMECMYVSVCSCLCVCFNLRISHDGPLVHPSVGPSVSPSVRPSVRLSVCRSVSLSVRPSVCPSVRPLVKFKISQNHEKIEFFSVFSIFLLVAGSVASWDPIFRVPRVFLTWIQAIEASSNHENEFFHAKNSKNHDKIIKKSPYSVCQSSN